MTETEHDHARPGTLSTPLTRDTELAPGRASRSAAMDAPANPVVSGLVARKAARDDNGVAEGADQAIATASSSSGMSLPAPIMRKFESSLGTDLSSVRVHTGAESASAASAVGAKAYTMGQDIHFGAGQYDPSSGAGEHLLAHEVAHTVQQGGGTPTRQNKLEVSAPGDGAEIEADRAADAMVSGSAASVTFGAGVQRKIFRDAATKDDKSQPSPVRDPTTAVISLSNGYQTLMEKQSLGLDNLYSDYQTKDDPTVADQAIQLAVVGALTAATGMITGPLVTAAVQAVASRITAAAASKAIQLGEQPLEQFLAAYTARTAAMTAKVQGWITAGIAAGVGSAMKPGALEPFRSFYEVQKNRLIDVKQLTQTKIVASMADFSGAAGIEMAQGILDAVTGLFASAIDTQYMSSLSQWSKIATGKINGSVTLTVPSLWARGGQISFTSAEIAGNDSIRNRLQQSATLSQRKLNEMPLPVTLKVTTPWKIFQGSSTWIATGSTVGTPGSFPTSGSGAYDLYRFGTGQDYTDKSEVAFDTGVNIGAALVFAALGELTWAQLPKLG